MLSNFGTGTGRGTEVFQNRGAGTDSVPVPALRSMVGSRYIVNRYIIEFFKKIVTFNIPISAYR